MSKRRIDHTQRNRQRKGASACSADSYAAHSAMLTIGVAENELLRRDIQTLMHETVAGPNTPERCCAHLVRRTLTCVLNYPIAVIW